MISTIYPCFFAAPNGFAVMRAWRAWAARNRDGSRSGFMLLRTDERPAGNTGPLVLASENLDAPALIALGHHSHVRLAPMPAAERATATLAERGTPSLTARLRALDDWAIEILLRTGETVCRSLIVGVRHREERFELVAWSRPGAPAVRTDISALTNAMRPWLKR